MTISERLHAKGVNIETIPLAEIVYFADQEGDGLSPEKQEQYYMSIVSILARSEKQIALMGRDMVIAQSKKEVTVLASGLKVGVENKAIQEYRADLYNGISDKLWPFTHLPKVDLDPSKNGLPVQIAMGAVDEVIFSLWDVGYDMEAGMENGELFTTIKAVLKEVMSWNFLKELGGELGVGVSDLLTNYDNTNGDLIYRKVRQLLIAFGIVTLLKSGLKKAVKKMGKMVGERAKQGKDEKNNMNPYTQSN